MTKASVSDVHLCHRCPRLLAYKLAGRRDAWRVGLRGDGSFPGKLFHEKIALPFHKKMASARDKKMRTALAKMMTDRPNEMYGAVHAFLDDRVLTPFLVQKADSLSVEAITALSWGVEVWSRHLANFLSGHDWSAERDPAAMLLDIFCPPEETISAPFPLKIGNLQITGKYDTLLLDRSAGEAVIVEFKGFKPRHEDEDFIQVAMYAWLIHQATGIRPRGVVLYLEEDQPEATYSARQLADSELNLAELASTAMKIALSYKSKGQVEFPLPPDDHLCEECPYDNSCDRDWGERTEADTIREHLERQPVPPHIKEKEGSRETDRLMDTLVNTLKVLKLPVEPIGAIPGPRLTRLKIKPLMEKGVTVKKIMNRAQDIQVAMAIKTEPLIRAQAGYLSVDIPQKSVIPLTLGDVLEKDGEKYAGGAAFPLGMAVDGAVEWADLTSPTMTSILVAGTAGSGKSVFLRAAVIGLAAKAKPEKLQITLIDPKRVTFTDMSGLPHLTGPVIMELKPAMETLRELVEGMEERYETFEKAGVVDISEYNQIEKPLPHHVVVIDEYADLMIDKDLKKDAELSIQRLCQKGRAAGYHLMLSTQRPDAKVVTPLIKANLQLKVALKVTTAANSNVILDESGAERLMGNGDMLVGGAIPIVRLQGPLPTKTEIMAAMNNT